MDKLTKTLYIDKKTFVRIFKENWDRYKRLSKYRKVEDENVQRLLGCGDPKNGFIQLRCTNCGESKIIPFSCKSRLCPSCTHIHLQERIMKIKSIMIKGVGHRHVVLTTPKELWGYFLKDRLLLNVMADAGAQLIKDVLSFYRRQGIEPGIILIIQTAGRALNFNPHLHLLITEGGLSKDGRWHTLSYISQDLLGRKWKYFLLSRLKGYLPKNERARKLIDTLFKEKPLFITYCKKEKKRKIDIVGYLVKYVISSPISYRRIIQYKDNEVIFRYQEREGAKNKVKRLTVFGFIYLLLQ
ncbi:transposase zinc-binding domain-containing protein, partial [Candidatus Aerophobetes bacterium]|nr:transposase zinc-binding domain-containing protein [Candidatus Aerophobetes bacterium]